MKRIICLTITLCLVLGSFSFVFADFGSGDSTNLSNTASRLQSILTWLQNNAPTYNGQSTMNSNLSTISNTLNTINGRLIASGISIATYTRDLVDELDDFHADFQTLMGWLDPANGGSTNALLQKIVGALTYIGENSGLGSWLADSWQLQSTYLPKLNDLDNLQIALTQMDPGVTSGFTSTYWRTHLHQNLFSSANRAAGIYANPVWDVSQGIVPNDIYAAYGTPLGNIAVIANRTNLNLVNGLEALLHGAVSSQAATNWGNLSNSTFTPASGIDGIYKWLSAIQTPVARLSYVLASDQDIEARQAVEVKQDFVVDQFLDDRGQGSFNTIDMANLSLASSDLSSNFNTGQSANGIWNTFSNSNFVYLSQEAADQLDTTGPNTRMLNKSHPVYPTPALDRYFEELNQILEVNRND